MQLKTSYFDAYKSLLKKQLEFPYQCIGLVGINESGKSNVLNALAVLSPENQLSFSDAPKMSRRTDPHVHFEFSADADELVRIKDAFNEWAKEADVEAGPPVFDSMVISYHVHFDKTTRTEQRYFTVDNVQLPTGVYLLSDDELTEGITVKIGDKAVPLNRAVMMTEDSLRANETFIELSKKLKEINEEIETFEAEIAKDAERLVAKLAAMQEASDVTGPPTEAANAEKRIEVKLTAEAESRQKKLRQQLTGLKEDKAKYDKLLQHFDLEAVYTNSRERFNALTETINALRDEVAALEASVETLEGAGSPSEEQKKKLATEQKKLSDLSAKLKKDEKERAAMERRLAALQQPLREKYTANPPDVSMRFGVALREVLTTMLPKVVLWKYSDDYILQGETEFRGMKMAKSINAISRPLVNLFRIGLGVNTLDELRAAIDELQNDSSERSRFQERLNRNVESYLKGVWPDFDQKISIALEQERIRVQFYDPACDDASYYNMQERSQGCQTFISFLLTVGAEAKHGVIRNTILLLDEPETHLHPSGVRYMLRELIKAAENQNTVVFATHSVFMIDKANYDRHVIIKKDREQTVIQPSKKDRIGFFMQEEVLYSALDVDLTNEFVSRKLFNFVLEGNGDAVLFDCFYNKALRTNDRPFDLNKTSIYHGGKCSDIKKYFSQKPIQLGATWVFILDKDPPANDLKAFIEGRYRDFIDKYIYVFQYDRDDLADKYVELEDLLPTELLAEVIKSAADQTGDSFDADRKIIAPHHFAACCDEIVQTCSDADEFKAVLKEKLNMRIADAVKDVKKKEDIQDLAPEFVSWATKMIKRIKDSRRPSGAAIAK